MCIRDRTYSGTVSGALEGALLGVPSIAVSQERTLGAYDFRHSAAAAATIAALGFGGLAASLVFGALWTRVSPAAAFLTGAVFALAASLLLYLTFSDATNSRHQR